MPELTDPIILLQATNWSSLIHARGYATDTPGHLNALIGDDPELQKAAVEHLSSSILGERVAWPATPVVAEVILGMMLMPILKPKLEPFRAELEGFLLRVGTIGRARRALDKLVPENPLIDISKFQRRYLERDGSDAIKLYYKSKIKAYSMKGCADFVKKLSFDGISCLEDRALIGRITNDIDGVQHSYMALSNPDTLYNPEMNTQPRQNSPPPLLTIIHPKQPNRKVLPSDELEPPTEL